MVIIHRTLGGSRPWVNFKAATSLNVLMQLSVEPFSTRHVTAKAPIEIQWLNYSFGSNGRGRQLQILHAPCHGAQVSNCRLEALSHLGSHNRDMQIWPRQRFFWQRYRHYSHTQLGISKQYGESQHDDEKHKLGTRKLAILLMLSLS